MEYLLEISRIVDGALKGDKAKVQGYVEQLARKLRDANDPASADRLLKAVDQTKPSEISTADFRVAPGIPVDSESRFSLADERKFLPSEVFVILDQVANRKIDEFLRFARAADRLLASNVGITPSILIYGPPGVGKTELAKYIAADLGLPLITARVDSLISSFLGSTAKNLRLLFEHAKARPCVLFLDELDSIAKLRDDHHELGELKRVVVSLLQNIDVFDNQGVLLGATNHPQLLDSAIWRRFSYKIELKLPSLEMRHQMFTKFLSEFAPPAEDLEAFCSIAQDLTGSDLRCICENAIRNAILSNMTKVDANRLLQEIVQLRLKDTIDFNLAEEPQVRAVYNLAPKVLTQRRLASLFSLSEPTISRRLNLGGNYGGPGTTSTDQNRTSSGRGLKVAASRRK